MLLSLRQVPSIAAWPQVSRPPTRLEQCLLLALLMHGLLVAWLGSAPGSARPGEGMWGRINVTLRGEPGPQREGSDSPAAPSKQRAEAAADKTPRIGGKVRTEAPATDAAPGAARIGQTNPNREEETLSRIADTAPGGQLQPLPSEKLGAASLSVSSAAPPTLPPTPQPQLRGQVNAVSPSALQKLPSLPSSAEVAVTAPSLSPSTRAMAPPEASTLKALPSSLPSATSVTSAIPELAAAPKPVSRLSEAAANPLIAKPLPALPNRVQTADTVLPALPQAPTPVGTISATAAPQTPSKPLPSMPAAVQASTAPTLAPLPDTPKPGPEPVQTTAASQAAAAPPTSSTSPSSSSPSANEAPQRTVTSPGASNAPAVGAPDAGSRVGADLALPPAPGASAPRLDLSLPRTGGPLARQGVKGMLDVLPVPPDKKTRLEQEVDAAKRADCRRAYEQAGILAVVPLVLDTARGKGCTWK